MTSFVSGSFEETIEIGKKIGALLKAGDIVCLRGDLGAGKTSLTKGIAQALGVPDEITSPTYTLIAEYKGTIPLYHMDLYRISGSEEFEMLGAEELLYGSGISLIEWSERIADSLPEEVKAVTITILADGGRRIDLEGLAL